MGKSQWNKGRRRGSKGPGGGKSCSEEGQDIMEEVCFSAFPTLRERSSYVKSDWPLMELTELFTVFMVFFTWRYRQWNNISEAVPCYGHQRVPWVQNGLLDFRFFRKWLLHEEIICNQSLNSMCNIYKFLFLRLPRNSLL